MTIKELLEKENGEELQPRDIEKYFTDRGKRQEDELGWTGYFIVSVKDILDFIIDFKS